MKQVQNRVNLLTWQRGKGMVEREEGGGWVVSGGTERAVLRTYNLYEHHYVNFQDSCDRKYLHILKRETLI